MNAHVQTTRIARTLTISPRTESRLSMLATATGLSRGAIVDMVLAACEACAHCAGTGTDPMNESRVCPSCRGERISIEQ